MREITFFENSTHPASSRARTPALLLAACLLAVACSETPTQPPDRVAFPRGEPTEELPVPAEEPTEEDVGENLLDLPPIDDALFGPVREAIARRNWIDAWLALPTPMVPLSGEVSEEQQATNLWIEYYRARIEFLRGDLQSHGARAAALDATPLPRNLRVELLEHLLTVAEARGDEGARFDLARRLLGLGGHPQRDTDACHRTLWEAAQRLPGGSRAPRAYDEISRGWLDLAAALHQDRPAAQALASVVDWQAAYPEHPGSETAVSLVDALGRDAAAENYALLLPLSGPLAAAGDALARGAFAGFYAEQAPGLALDVLDSRRFPSAADALDSRDVAPAVVLGPLGKEQVSQLLQSPPLDQPVLTLNRPEPPLTSPTVLQLALAPEDEARQLAELAFADGARRALLLRPETAWGSRISRVFEQRWAELGGQLAGTVSYADANGYSNLIRDALALDASEDRGRRLRSLFSDGIETSGRRRDDLDAVFLLNRRSNEARALKPLLNYHYAGDLPAYALSTADAGGQDPARDRDLEGLRLLVMPWRVATDPVPGLGDSPSAGGYDALHALGSDAYRIARRWSVLHSDAQPLHRGFTAALQADADGVLQRRLQPAEFHRGTLRPR